MEQIERIWQTVKRLGWKAWGIAALLLIVLMVLMRGCSNHSATQLRSSYRIAYDGTWYPLQISDKAKNISAFSTELLFEVAKREKFRVELIPQGPDSLVEGLDDGSYDGILSGMEPDALHRNFYAFSNPYFLTGPVLVVTQNSPVRSFQEMEGKIVGIKTDSLLLFNVPTPSMMLMLPYDSILVAFADLDKGLIDGVIVELLPAHAYTSGFYAGRLRIATAPLNDTGIRLVMKHTPYSESLIERFDASVDHYKETGRYKELLNRWGLFQTALINLDAPGKAK